MRSSVAALALVTAASLATSVAAPAAAGPVDRAASASASTARLVVPRTTASARPRKVPRLRVVRMVKRLHNPWDVAPVGRRAYLVTQRERARLTLWRPGKRRISVAFPRDQVWVAGETGLMGLAVDPAYRTNHRFYTCQGGFTAGGHDVRVMAWRLVRGGGRASAVDGQELVGGFPTTSGRHGGCRLLVVSDGSLLVGTGDAADEDNPQNLHSLGGKTLRLDRFTGAPWPANPFIGSANSRERYVDTYGHRNVQGLAERRDGTLWSIEQGTDRDDEVNLLTPGGNYGWAPGPGYDESRPMTDPSLPGVQIAAAWRSGYPTLATSGGTFVRGRKWGRLRGTLAVAALKAERVVFLRFDGDGRLVRVRVPKKLRGTYGRLRTVVRAPNNDLLVTTDNGSRDAVLRISPRR